jgi:hypothetical protein
LRGGRTPARSPSPWSCDGSCANPRS